jgi:hypothetical protein
MRMPWEKQEPDYNEIPDFLKRELPKPVNREDNPPTKDQSAPLPWEPNFSSRS